MTVVWEAKARTEVGDIFSYLFDLSPVLADNWIDELNKKINLLMTFPEMGRIVPDYEISFIREVFVRRYRLIYQFQEETIRILAVRPMGQPLGRI